MRAASSDDLGGAVVSHAVIRSASSGWRAELDLRFARRRGRTVIATRRQSGPLTVQRAFYPEPEGVCHTYLLHPPAGIVGGDELAMSFDLESGAHALVTTPAATRWYFSRGQEARARQHATLAGGATLEWLPQETLLFDGAHARLETRIDLAATARFCGWEILGLGRPACGETFRNGRIDFRFELFRDGRPLLLERLRGGAGGLAGMREHAACATLLATPAGAPALEAAREALADAPDVLAGATLIGDLLIGRGLAARCEPLTHTFMKLWSALRPLVLGYAAVPPRIWQT
jgi:urease accessory protein